MLKNIAMVALVAGIVALPFCFRTTDPESVARPGDATLVIITPNNEAIRREFARGFSRWHEARYGQPVTIDWRVIGGATEIMRYLEAAYTAAFRSWWQASGKTWPAGAGGALLDRAYHADRTPPPDVAADPGRLAEWQEKRELRRAFCGTDEPSAFSCRIDLFFGGGTFDHAKAAAEGLIVPPWPPDQAPPDTLRTPQGAELIPAALGGEVWRTDTFFGTALSTFGICYNRDRLRDLGLSEVPRRWVDLTAPELFRQVAVCDPTKSGSIAKAFEMIVQQQCWEAVRAAGFSDADVARLEARIRSAGLPVDRVPDDVPPAYQAAVERGWLAGVRLLQRIGANARYFTDSAGKVTLDVSAGDAAAGIAIDFFGRFQASYSRDTSGVERMAYVTPVGGSSVSADPVSLLRGAEHRELAARFIAFALSEDGQRLWNYTPGAPGGPQTFALRRLPIRRDFYPADATFEPSAYARHRPFYTDDLGDPAVNPYVLGRAFDYQPRWTGNHFGVLRDLVRAMCMDSGDELQAAWQAIRAAGGPAQRPAAMALLERLPDRPEPLTWASALTMTRARPRLDTMRDWTICFRRTYAEARRAAEAPDHAPTGSP